MALCHGILYNLGSERFPSVWCVHLMLLHLDTLKQVVRESVNATVRKIVYGSFALGLFVSGLSGCSPPAPAPSDKAPSRASVPQGVSLASVLSSLEYRSDAPDRVTRRVFERQCRRCHWTLHMGAGNIPLNHVGLERSPTFIHDQIRYALLKPNMPAFSIRKVSENELNHLVHYLGRLKMTRLKAKPLPSREDRVPLDLEHYAIQDGAASYRWVRRYLTHETRKRLDGYNRSRPLTEEENRRIRDDLRSYEQRSLQNRRRQPKTK
jgi:hypothetical protein